LVYKDRAFSSQATYYCDHSRTDGAKREGGAFHCITDLAGQKTRSNPYIFGIVCGLNHRTAATVRAWKRICSHATKNNTAVRNAENAKVVPSLSFSSDGRRRQDASTGPEETLQMVAGEFAHRI